MLASGDESTASSASHLARKKRVRCAAEALAAHPSFESLAPLLRTLQATSSTDTHLHYVLRKALRT